MTISERTGTMLVNKKDKKSVIIDIAVSGDVRIEKEDKKMERYRSLHRELRRVEEVQCLVVPVTNGKLGTIPMTLHAIRIFSRDDTEIVFLGRVGDIEDSF